MAPETKTIALVLAGAVARGAFEAGVIRALVNTDVKIVRIVAASAGALNGTVLASSVRGRNIRAGAEALHALWRDLTELVRQGVLDPAQRYRVLEALGWTGRRSVQVVQIRPRRSCAGARSRASFDAAIRSEQLEAGFVRGQEVLRGLGWSP